MRTKSILGTIVLSLALLLFTPSAVAAQGESSPNISSLDPVDDPDFDFSTLAGEEVRVGPSLQDSKLVGYVGGGAVGQTVGNRSIPFNPLDSANCDLGGNASWVIDTVHTWPYTNGSETRWPGGDVDLLCGTDTSSGFKHIRSRHQWSEVNSPNSWESVRDDIKIATGSYPSETWDQFMWDAVNATVNATPFPGPEAIAGQKTCFHAPYRIYAGQTVISTNYANTIVSRNNFVVVTAYLSNSHQASSCLVEPW